MDKLISEHNYRVQDAIPCCANCANADTMGDVQLCTIYEDCVADKLASISIDTFQRANNKLQSVSRCSVPEQCEKDPGLAEQYPPLFESLRTSLKTIERNLSGINDCLDRVEL